eukprot:823384-Prymnesium_polylepis.1
MSCSSDDACSWSERWSSLPGVELTYSTTDNSRPPQTAAVDCPYGEALTPEGLCVCDNGFERDSSGERCKTCEVSQDSRRATANTSSSEGCTMCAVGFYRPHAHLTVSACVRRARFDLMESAHQSPQRQMYSLRVSKVTYMHHRSRATLFWASPVLRTPPSRRSRSTAVTG